jgi:hypothetical protein
LKARKTPVTDSKPNTFLRDIKLPAGMTATRSLRDYLVGSSAKDQSTLGPAQIEDHNKRVLDWLLTSHFEVVDYLGKLEESLQHGDRPPGLL